MANNDETLFQSPGPRFDTTQWSLVMQAGHRSSPAGRAAFAQLCQQYWYPLYAHVRSLGYGIHRAQDLIQGFFERVIEKNYVGDADRSPVDRWPVPALSLGGGDEPSGRL